MANLGGMVGKEGIQRMNLDAKTTKAGQIGTLDEKAMLVFNAFRFLVIFSIVVFVVLAVSGCSATGGKCFGEGTCHGGGACSGQSTCKGNRKM